MDSQWILASALETIHRTMLKTSNVDELPELSLYRPAPIRDADGEGADAASGNVTLLNELTVDAADDQKSEPGLQSSIRHGDKHVATASTERERGDQDRSDDRQGTTEEWFGGITWSKDGSEPGPEEQNRPSEKTEKSSPVSPGQNTEEFFTGVNWDADSTDEQNAADLNLFNEPEENSKSGDSSSGDAADFFESTDWDGGSGDQSPRRAPKPDSDSEEDAETFLGDTDWDGGGQAVSINPDGEPPEHVRKMAEADRGDAAPPATEDAIKRSEEAKMDDQKDDKE